MLVSGSDKRWFTDDELVLYSFSDIYIYIYMNVILFFIFFSIPRHKGGGLGL